MGRGRNPRGVEARFFGHLDSGERADLVRRLQRMRFRARLSRV
jgi:hypothetical protein